MVAERHRPESHPRELPWARHRPCLLSLSLMPETKTRRRGSGPFQGKCPQERWQQDHSERGLSPELHGAWALPCSWASGGRTNASRRPGAAPALLGADHCSETRPSLHKTIREGGCIQTLPELLPLSVVEGMKAQLLAWGQDWPIVTFHGQKQPRSLQMIPQLHRLWPHSPPRWLEG